MFPHRSNIEIPLNQFGLTVNLRWLRRWFALNAGARIAQGANGPDTHFCALP